MEDRHVQLPDPKLLVPAEREFWTPDGALPDDASTVVRGSPISPEKLLSHATRQAREHSLRGRNMASVSVDLLMPGWPLERILAEQLVTYSRYATCPIATLQGAGFEVLATGREPHADVVLPVLSIVEATRLSELLSGTEERNPHKGRR